MTPTLIFTGLISYFLILLTIGFITGRKANSSSYFLGNKESLWWMVALGMLSDSMSGVSFIGVPGAVKTNNFYYMQVVMGYFVGYLVIAYVLLPLYYKHNVTSIYTYLYQRFGIIHQRTGAFFFIVSRLLGSAGRLYLTADILQTFLFNAWGVPFVFTVTFIIILILAYTIKGGIRTLVFTDALQSVFLIGGLVVCISTILFGLNTQEGYFSILEQSPYVSFFNWDVWSPTFFGKQFIGGMFICIAMTGLDQNMMQKNLSCKTPQESQKNMITTAFVVLLVNFLFVNLGVFMIEYLKQVNPAMLTDPSVKTDMYFPIIALQYLGPFAGMAFVLGLSAATFSSADSVLTTLTTSTYFDLLGINAKDSWSDTKKQKVRNQLHILFAFLLLLSILGFYEFSNGAIIDVVLSLANYTYGPLLGLFALGIFTKFKPDGLGIVWVSLIAPILCWILAKNQFITQSLGWDSWNWKYQFGFELILLNGMFSFIGYWLVLKVTKRL